MTCNVWMEKLDHMPRSLATVVGWTRCLEWPPVSSAQHSSILLEAACEPNQMTSSSRSPAIQVARGDVQRDRRPRVALTYCVPQLSWHNCVHRYVVSVDTRLEIVESRSEMSFVYRKRSRMFPEPISLSKIKHDAAVLWVSEAWIYRARIKRWIHMYAVRMWSRFRVRCWALSAASATGLHQESVPFPFI